MKDSTDKLVRSANLAAKGGVVLQKRLQNAQEHLAERVRGIQEAHGEAQQAV